MTKTKKTIPEANETQIADLTADLQRIRADFENYRKQVEREKTAARSAGQSAMVMKLLPVIDNIDRAITHVPADLSENKWAQGIVGLGKQLEKSLEGLGLMRINAQAGVPFDPEFHEAVQLDEDAEGEHEVVAEELQAGYLLDNRPIRHAMVKVTRQ